MNNIILDQLIKEYTVSYEDIMKMSCQDRKVLMQKVTAVLDCNGYIDEYNIWDAAYATYSNLTAISDEEYYNENIDKFNAWVNEHISGKSYGEIDPHTWDYYSDWHKDIFGVRPHGSQPYICL